MEAFTYCSRTMLNSVANNDFRHRFHHIAQIQLVSPFLFDVKYENEHIQRWMEEADLLPIDDNCEFQDVVKVVKSRIRLCISVYSTLTRKFRGEPIVSSNNEVVFNTLKWLNKCRPTLDQLILKTKTDWKWMIEICDEVNSGSEKEVVALILTLLHIMMTSDKLIENFDKLCDENDKDCELLKNEGDFELNNNNFQSAIEIYTHALIINPFCPEIYTNRSQAYMEVNEYLKAEMDAIRSIFLKCDSTKGYNLLITALEKQGYTTKAYYVGKQSIYQCRFLQIDCDLQKIQDFCKSINTNAEKFGFKLENDICEDIKEQESNTDTSDDDSENNNINEPENENKEQLIQEIQENETVEEIIESNEENESKNSQNPQTSVENPRNSIEIKSKKKMDQNEIKHIRMTKTWRSMVFEASTNLVNQHYKLASQLYSDALKYYRENLTQDLVQEEEIVLVKYSYGISCVETRSREEMLNSIIIFNEILEKHSNVVFPLVYYGLTYSYFKQNRFKEALQIAKNCLENTKDTVLSALTWPEIDKNIPESTAGKFKLTLEKLIDICQSPPPPNAICRYIKCNGHFKNEIYLTDPDCKGFIKITCDEGCSLQYHNNCWKNIKDDIKISNDKEFLDTSCLTPDCPGGIMELIHIDCKGEMAKKFKSNTWTKGGFMKQKRPRSSKKSNHKEKKKKKDEIIKDDKQDDIEQAEYESLDTIAATIFDLKPTQTETPTKIPIYPPENVEFMILKKQDELDETIRKPEKHKEKKKEKKKQVLKLNEFFADVKEDEENGQMEIKNTPNKRKRKKRLNAQNIEFETASRHSSESDQTSSLSRDMCDEELATASRESLVNETIKRTLFDSMKIFLKQTGQLSIDDHRLIEELAKLSIEIQEYIADIGGIQEFLKKSDDFVVYGNVMCLTEHFGGAISLDDSLNRCNSVGEQCSMLDTITECYEMPSKSEWVEAKPKWKSKKEKNDAKWSGLDDVKDESYMENDEKFDSYRNEEENSEINSQTSSGLSQHYANLQKLWKFVPKFSDKGQGQMLRLVLKLIIKERILERFSPNPENVGRAKETFRFAIDALSNSIECETQTNNNLIHELDETKLENDELKKQVKEHEDLIAYLLTTKRQKWEEEKKELEKKVDLLSKNLKMVDEAKNEAENAKSKLIQELNELKQVNVRPVRSAVANALSNEEIRCSSAPNATRSRESVSGLTQPYSVNPSGKSLLSSQTKMLPLLAWQQGNPKNSYEKLMNVLENSFPTVDREELKGHVQQLRGHCANNRLSGLTIDQIVKEISNMIRMKIASRKGQQVPLIGGMGLERITQPGNAWSKVKTNVYDWENPEEMEEPCIICHEELKNLHKLCTLQCRHRFHESCIKEWFKQENTCPTCRAHSLLPDEFPCLS